MAIGRRKMIVSTAAAILGGTGTASARSSRADERLEEHFGDGRHPGQGKGKGNAHGPDLKEDDDDLAETFTVTVVNADTGEPIEGAKVVVSTADVDPADSETYTDYTDENGEVVGPFLSSIHIVEVYADRYNYYIGESESSFDQEYTAELVPTIYAQSESSDS